MLNFDELWRKGKYILVVPVLLSLLLVVFLGSQYLQVNKELSSSPPPNKISPALEKKYREESEEEFSKLHQELANFSPEPLIADSSCYDVPIFQSDPWLGCHKVEYPSNDFFEWYYEGKVVDVVDKKIDNCDYKTITLDRNGLFYELNIPQGLPSTQYVGLPSLYPENLKDHPDQRLVLKMRFRRDRPEIPLKEKKTPTLKLLEWEFYAMMFN